jgi:hypothetical protein
MRALQAAPELDKMANAPTPTGPSIVARHPKGLEDDLRRSFALPITGLAREPEPPRFHRESIIGPASKPGMATADRIAHGVLQVLRQRATVGPTNPAGPPGDPERSVARTAPPALLRASSSHLLQLSRSRSDLASRRGKVQSLVVRRGQFFAEFPQGKRQVTFSDEKISTHSTAAYLADHVLRWCVQDAGQSTRPISWQNKTLFPYSWNEQMIIAAIKYIYENTGQWISTSPSDEDAHGQYNGLSITLRRKKGTPFHVTSVWPTGPNLLFPHAEFNQFTAALQHMDQWIGYFQVNSAHYRSQGDYDGCRKLGEMTKTALIGYAGTSMEYYVRGTYHAAEMLRREAEEQMESGHLNALVTEAETSTSRDRLRELKKALFDLMNSSTSEIIAPILKTIDAKLAD